MTAEKEFVDGKKRAIQELEKAKSEDKVDQGILPILDRINSSDLYYTSSSCFGRIVLLELPVIGDKKNAKWLGKWHRKVKSDDVLSAVKNASVGQLWILAQSPIIHVAAKTNDAADRMLKTAIACGFKNSGLKSIDKNIMVEVCSTERLDAPVGKDGNLFCNEDYLGLLIDIANSVFERSSAKLSKFEDRLKEDF